MIESPEQFELALERINLNLEAPPPQGTPEHDDLMARLREIAAYSPRARNPRPAADPASHQALDRLTRHLDTFEARVTRHFGQHWAAMVGGDLGRD